MLGADSCRITQESTSLMASLPHSEDQRSDVSARKCGLRLGLGREQKSG